MANAGGGFSVTRFILLGVIALFCYGIVASQIKDPDAEKLAAQDVIKLGALQPGWDHIRIDEAKQNHYAVAGEQRPKRLTGSRFSLDRRS